MVEFIVTVLTGFLAAAGGSAWVAAHVPASWLKFIPMLNKLIQFLGANFGHAKNKKD